MAVPTPTVVTMRQAQVVLERTDVFPCNRCTRAFLHAKDLEKHSLSHTRKNGMLLKENNINFNNRQEDNSGIYVKKYECYKCGLKFVLESTLSTHLSVHSRQHVCHCGISYYKQDDLKAHIKLVHPDYIKPIEVIKPKQTENKSTKAKINKAKQQQYKIKRKGLYFMCDICNKSLSSKSGVIVHMRTHTGERPYKCPHCDKRFTQISAVKIHSLRHTSTRNFACDFCPKKFVARNDLTLHNRIHTGEKPFKCENCSKAFSDPSAYKRHLRIHTQEYMYFCKDCPMKFTDASGLIAHRKRHIGLRTVKCNFCSKTWYNNSELKIHLKKFHSMHT